MQLNRYFIGYLLQQQSKMSFTPFNMRDGGSYVPRQTRQSQTPISYQIPSSPIQVKKQFQPWNKNQEMMKNNYSGQYPGQIGQGRGITSGNLPLNSPKQVVNQMGPNFSNFKQPHFNQTNMPNINQSDINSNNKFTSNSDLSRSLIYANNLPNPIISPDLQKFNLNSSGGNRINQFNPGTPRKIPRVSEGSLPTNSEINYNPQPKQNNIPERQGSFNKNRNYIVENLSKETQELQKMQKIQKIQKMQKIQKLEGVKDQKNQMIFLNRPTKANSVKQGDKVIKNNVVNGKGKHTLQSFIKIKELGSGKYGQVFLVKDKQSGFICALKVIPKQLLIEQQITNQFVRELKIQMYVNHPNIVKLYGFFDDKENIYLILQVATGGQLFHMLKKSQSLPEQKVAGIMRQVCEAVAEIHSLRIIHRDIKPQNIVIHDGIIKLCDFGWSVYQDKNLRTTFCGTPLYVCPQILKGKQYDQKIDIWSLGIMIYQMLIGENPFRITKEEELIKIIKDEFLIPKYATVSKEGRDFLQKCLKKNPDDRSTIRELLDHQFFKKYPEKQAEKKMMKFQ